MRWERYRVISGLHKQEEVTQIDTFLYAMGCEAEDVLIPMRLTDEESRDYQKLTAAFDRYFIPCKNVIFERARFNLRSQLEHEPVEVFTKDLHRPADACDFGAIKDELIRDTLVVGLRDLAPSKKLQLYSGLTLEKAVSTARISEAVKGQQEVLRVNGSTEKTALDAVTTAKQREKQPLHAHTAGYRVSPLVAVVFETTASRRSEGLGSPAPATRTLRRSGRWSGVVKCPGLFGSLGQLKATYHVRLVPGAKPHAVTYPRRVPIPLLPSAQAKIHRKEELGVIQGVEHATEWCPPMVVAKKKGGKLRISVDYAELNKQIVRKCVIMPTVEENLRQTSGAKVFSKLDTNAGNWQAQLSPESSELSALITPLGRYKFLCLHFAIATAPEFSQREMLRTLKGLQGTTCHMDDVLVYGKDEEEHDERLHAVLQKLSDAGVTLNKHQCQFRRREILFLSHIHGPGRTSADPEKKTRP